MKSLNTIQRISRSCLAILAVLTLTLTGCDSISSNDAPEVEAVASNGRTSVGTMYAFSDMSEVGTSTLRRNNEAIALTINTSELEPNYAYTVWWVVFDKPEYCSAPGCGADDIFENALVGGPNEMEFTLLGAADGSVIGPNGRANYRGALAKNDVSQVTFGDGLDNPMTAEIHYVIRSHGPAIPGMIEEQTTTHNAGCFPGEPNEGLCEDVQFAIHKAQ